MKKHVLILGASLLLSGIISTKAAAPAGPTFPPPGGVSTANSGTVAADTLGRTLFYYNFDPSSYTELYWSFYDIRNPHHSTQPDTGAMSFVNYNGGTGIATFQSTAPMVWSTATGLQSISTKLELQFQPYTGTQSGPLASGWLNPMTASTAGITSLPPSYPVLRVDPLPDPDNFQVWFRYETTAGTALLDYYDGSESSGGSVLTSATGGFYSVVPEPGILSFLGLGCGLLAARARKKTV